MSGADDKKSYVSLGGVSREVTPEQENEVFGTGSAEELYGAKNVSKQQALQENQEEVNRLHAEAMPTAVQAGTGVIQGATFGLGVPMMIKAEELMGMNGDIDRQRLAGLRQGGLFSAYGAGQAAGLVGGSVLTGGLLDEIGLATKVGALLPEATGITGAAIQGAGKVGAQGAIEGSFMGLGKAMEDSVIQNKDLASEAVLASMGEGALMGAGFGAAFGAVGGGISRAARGIASSGTVRDAAEGYLAKRAGLTRGSIIKEIGEMEDGMRGFMSRSSELLESEGVKLSSSPQAIVQAAERVELKLSKQIQSIGAELDNAAVPKPSWNRFIGRVKNDVFGEAAMAPGGLDKAAEVDAYLKRMMPVESLNPLEGLKSADFSGWIRGREDMLARSRGLPGDMGQRVMAAYDSELAEAMRYAESSNTALAGVSGRYQGALLAKRTMQVLGEAAESRLGLSGGGITPGDLGTGGAIALAGHPLSAASYVAGKAIGRGLQETYGPALAEAVWKASSVAKVTAAVQQLKSNVSKAVTGLFMGSTKQAIKAANITRAQFNKELEDFYKFSQKAKEARLENYMQATKMQALAGGMNSVAERAISAGMQNAPQADGVSGIGSLRKKVNPNGLRVQEYMFKTKLDVIKNPMSVLKAAENGRVSKEQIQTLKEVWPETYNLVVTEAQSRIAEMKATGKSLPVDKITQLSILLDSPLDTVMTKEFIQPVQVALNTVEPAPAVKPAPAPSNQAESESYETPGEQII